MIQSPNPQLAEPVGEPSAASGRMADVDARTNSLLPEKISANRVNIPRCVVMRTVTQQRSSGVVEHGFVTMTSRGLFLVIGFAEIIASTVAETSL